MRRWIALLLIALLPLQVSWSVAAEYGNHGATLAAPHAELHANGDANGQANSHAHDEAATTVAAAEAGIEAQAASADETDTHTACCDLHQCTRTAALPR